MHSREYADAVIAHYRRWRSTSDSEICDSSDSDSVSSGDSTWRDADLVSVVETLKGSPARSYF